VGKKKMKVEGRLGGCRKNFEAEGRIYLWCVGRETRRGWRRSGGD